MNYVEIYNKLIDKIDNKKKFIIIHNTSTKQNLIDILKDREIKSLNKLDKAKGKKGQNFDTDLIYTITYFYDIKNLTHLPDYCLILSSELFYDYDTFFNNSWQGGIMKTTIKTKDINKIKKRIINPKVNKKLKKLIINSPLNHELIFNKSIPLDKYLIGIVCNGCDIEDLNKLTNVAIFTDNVIPNINLLTFNK